MKYRLSIKLFTNLLLRAYIHEKPKRFRDFLGPGTNPIKNITT